MSKTIYVAIASILLLAACSEDTMDRINKNINDPTTVASRYTLTDIMVSSAFSVTGSDLAFYASSYIEHNVGIYNQLYNAEIRNGEPYSSTTYNNSWLSIYRNLYSLKGVIEKCSPGGSEEGNYVNLGIAQILTAYNLAILTDEFGDVPYTQALQPGVIFQPALTTQKEIYAEVFQCLADGIANLSNNMGVNLIGSQDVIYNGDVSLWIKAAYALKARYLMRLSKVQPDYQGVIEAINLSFASSSEEFVFAQYDGSSTVSPFYAFFTDRNYFGASQSLHQKLMERNDPRDSIFFKPIGSADSLIFAPNGTPDQKQDYYSICALTNGKAPTYLMSYHELLFLKAEAYLRKGNIPEAENALKSAVEAAFVKVGLTVDAADEYFTNSVLPLFNNSPEPEIAMQKYLAFYQSEALEAYNDYRRQAAMGTVIPLANQKAFPQRYTYGSSDVTTNPNVRAAYGDGQYVNTEPVWWAGGVR